MLKYYHLLTAFAVIVLKILWSRRAYYILSWKLEGRWSLPLLGSYFSVIRHGALKHFNMAADKYKSPVIDWFGPFPQIFISDPNIAKIIFTSPNISKSMYYKVINKMVGDNLVSLESPTWNLHRKLLNPALSFKNIKNFLTIFNSETNVFVDKLKDSVDNGEIYIKRMLYYLNTEIACQTIMGKKMNLQSSKAYLTILRAIMGRFTYASRRVVNLLLHIDWIYKRTKNYKEYQTISSKSYDFAQELIESRMNEYQNGNDELGRHLLIDILISLTQSGKFKWDDVQSEMYAILPAAIETTTMAEYTLIILLAMHPEIQEKVYEEISKKFPCKIVDILYEDLNELPYLEMVINESMRLLAPVPYVSRGASDDIEFPNGLIIPKGVEFIVNIFSMQRDEKYWGPKAKEFYPEHFSPENLKKVNPYAFVPFTKGLRNCIGNKYAMISMKIFLIKTLLRYRFTTNAKLNELDFTATIALHFKKNPLVQVFER